jgi:integrase
MIMSSIDKLPSGNFQARWRDPSGASRSLSFPLRRDAVRHLATIDADMIAGKYTDPRSGRTTVQAYATRWAASQPWEPSTAQRIAGTLSKWIFPTFGTRSIGSIRPTELQGWSVKLGQSMAASTARNVWYTMTDLLAAAVVDRVIGVDPSATVSAPEKVNAEIQIPTPDEVRRLIAATPARYRAAPLLASIEGLRAGEVFGLCDDRITLGGTKPLRRLAVAGTPRPGTISVTRQLACLGAVSYLKPPKSKSGIRELDAAAGVNAALSEHTEAYPPAEISLPRDRPNGAMITVNLLFTTESGQPVSRKLWSEIWTRVQRDAGVTCRFHDLRHFAISAMIRMGASIEEVRTFAGHSDARTTLSVYGHMWEDSRERTLTALDAAMETLTPQRKVAL